MVAVDVLPRAGGGASGFVKNQSKKLQLDPTEVFHCNRDVPWMQLRMPAGSNDGSRSAYAPTPPCLLLFASPCTCDAPPSAPPLLQARMRAIADIVAALVGGVRSGEDVDLNQVKRGVRRAGACYGGPSSR